MRLIGAAVFLLASAPQETASKANWIGREAAEGVRLSTCDFTFLWKTKQKVAAGNPHAVRVIRAAAPDKIATMAPKTGASVVIGGGWSEASVPCKADGVLVSRGWPAWPVVGALLIDPAKGFRPSIKRVAKEEDLRAARHALGGPLLVERKAAVDKLDSDAWPKELRDRQPRVLAGLSGGGRKFHVIVAQGGDGFTLAESARFLLELGCESGVAIGGGAAASAWTLGLKDRVALAAAEEAPGEVALAFDAPPVVLVDNNDPECQASGEWVPKGDGKGMYGNAYLFNDRGSGGVNYQLHVPQDGTYEVFLTWPAVKEVGCVSVSVATTDGVKTVPSVAQYKNAGAWFSLGQFSLGTAGTTVSISPIVRTGQPIIADAVRIVRRK